MDDNGEVWAATLNGVARWGGFTNILTFTTDSGFVNGVSPSSGVSGTEFEFRVKYQDEGNIPPDKAQIWIDLNYDDQYDDYEKFHMSPLDPNDQEYKNGVIFNYKKSIY